MPAASVCTAKSEAVKTCGNKETSGTIKHESMLAPVQAQGSAACTSYHKRNALMQNHMLCPQNR